MRPGWTVRVFNSHAEADEADRRYYQQLLPAERLDLLLELITKFTNSENGPTPRLARVSRVTKLSSR
jgi:hypothetical protein